MIRARVHSDVFGDIHLRGGITITRDRAWSFLTVAQLEALGWDEITFQDFFHDNRIQTEELDENSRVVPLREEWRLTIRAKDPTRFTSAGYESAAPQLFERKTSSGWIEWALDQHLEAKGEIR